jgi:hypothetical protein
MMSGIFRMRVISYTKYDDMIASRSLSLHYAIILVLLVKALAYGGQSLIETILYTNKVIISLTDMLE